MYSFYLCAQRRAVGVLEVNLSPKLAPIDGGSSVLCPEKETGCLCRETPGLGGPCSVWANGTEDQCG